MEIVLSQLHFSFLNSIVSAVLLFFEPEKISMQPKQLTVLICTSRRAKVFQASLNERPKLPRNISSTRESVLLGKWRSIFQVSQLTGFHSFAPFMLRSALSCQTSGNPLTSAERVGISYSSLISISRILRKKNRVTIRILTYD